MRILNKWKIHPEPLELNKYQEILVEYIEKDFNINSAEDLIKRNEPP